MTDRDTRDAEAEVNSDMLIPHDRSSPVSGLAYAWTVERPSDPTFPRLCRTKAEADALVKFVNVSPAAIARPLYVGHAQRSPDEQPVAWRARNDFGHWAITQDQALAETWRDTEGYVVEPLYAIPDADRARIRELEAALEPFVAHYSMWMDQWGDDVQSSVYPRHTFGDIRRVRIALRKEEAAFPAEAPREHFHQVPHDEGKPDLAALWQAVIDNTKGSGFWLGEILLTTIERETGYRP